MKSFIYFIETFGTIFVVLTPLVGMSCFVALSAGVKSTGERSRIALKTALAVATIMIAFIIGGNYLFRLFGITLGAFQIAGGIIIFSLGFSLVRANTGQKYTAEEAREGNLKEDFAVVPLATPMICGPATISTVVLYAAEADAEHLMLLIIAALTAAAAVWVLLRLSSRISRLLGVTGMNVLTRIMGLLLAAIAVQIIIRGATAAYSVVISGGR